MGTNTVTIDESGPTTVVTIQGAGPQGVPGQSEHINVLNEGISTSGVNNTALFQTLVNKIDDPTNAAYFGKAIYMPTPRSPYNIGQFTYQYPIKIIGEAWRSTIIQPAAGLIPNGQYWAQHAGTQGSNLTPLTVISATSNGTSVTITFAALPTAPATGSAIVLKGFIASGAALPHEYNGSYPIGSATTTSVTFQTTFADAITTLGQAWIVSTSYQSHGVDITNIQVNLSNYSGTSAVGVFQTQQFQSNRSGRVSQCFFKAIPGYCIDKSDSYNWDLSDNRYEICGNFLTDWGGGVLNRASTWNGGGKEAATPDYTANCHYQHCNRNVDVYDENSDTGNPRTGLNANWNYVTSIGDVSEQQNRGSNFGANSTNVVSIQPYFESGGLGHDNYGNADQGTNAGTLQGKNAITIGGYFANYTGGGTQPTPDSGIFSGTWGWDNFFQQKYGIGSVTTITLDKGTGDITIKAPTTGTGNAHLILDATLSGGNAYQMVSASNGQGAIQNNTLSNVNPITWGPTGVTAFGPATLVNAISGTTSHYSIVLDNLLGSVAYNQYFDTTSATWKYIKTGYAFLERTGNDGTWTLYANPSATAGTSISSNAQAIQVNKATSTITLSLATTVSSTLTATAFIPSGTTVPTNGLYLPATNTLAWATGSTKQMQLSGTALVLGTSYSIGTTSQGTLISNNNVVDTTYPSYALNCYFDTALNGWYSTRAGYCYVVRSDNGGNLDFWSGKIAGNVNPTAGGQQLTLTKMFSGISGGGMTTNGTQTATLFSGSGASLTSIPNGALTNNSVTIGSTNIALGATSTTLAGLTSVTATTFTGALSGNATSSTTATSATSANTATTATNIAGGAAGSIPYQTASGLTALLATAAGVLVGGTTPAYSTAPALTGTNFTAIPNAALSNSSITFTAGTGISISTATPSLGGSTTISIGQSVATSASPTFAGLTINGSTTQTGNSTQTGNDTINGNLAISGTVSNSTSTSSVAIATGVNVTGIVETTQLASPGAPASVTPTGGASTTQTYAYTAVDVLGQETSIGSTLSTNVGPTTLSSSNFNTVVAPSSLPTGAVSLNLYRTVGGTTQGLIATGVAAGGTTLDKALTATPYKVSTVAPLQNFTGGIQTNTRAPDWTNKNDPSVAVFWDDFISIGQNTAITAATAFNSVMKWTAAQVSAGTCSITADATNDGIHYGVIKLTNTTTTSGDGVALFTAGGSNSAGVCNPSTQKISMIFAMKLNSTATNGAYFGFLPSNGQTTIPSGATNIFLGIRYDTSLSDTALTWVTGNGTTQTLSTSIAADTNWHKFCIRTDGAGNAFVSIDDGLETQFASNLPNRLMDMGFIGVNRTTTSSIWFLDYTGYQMTGLKR
jgi:hypothetical protein